MGYTELINILEQLPPDRQAEVFDFAAFLAARGRTAPDEAGRGHWNETEFARFSLDQAMRGMEEDSVAYTTSDLTERWQ